jgi:ABC-2 type transport system ATP-binding protein
VAERPIISVENISKDFKLPHERYTGLKQAFINFRKGKQFERQQVLKNVTFDIKRGEFFGIVGRNGSGKSTLLKIIAQTYVPNKGAVHVNGSLTPFIELGVGFNPELTGRENVFLNGALLGFDRKQVNSMYNDIVDFAELPEFMDQRLKNYSSGMLVRLAFSIAIRARSDILLLDEVLAVGDEAFQRKCISYFETLKRNNKTVVLVTHDMGSVERFCTRAMFIEDGSIKLIGNAREVASAYSRSNDESYKVDQNDSLPAEETKQEETYGLSIVMKNAAGKETVKFTANETLVVCLRWNNPEIKHASVTILKQSGENMFGTGTYQDKFDIKELNKVDYEVACNLQEGEYYLKVGLGREGEQKPAVLINKGPTFVISRDKDDARWDGLTKLSHRWKQ